MKKLKSELDLATLLIEVEKLKFNSDGSGAYMAIEPCKMVNIPGIGIALQEISRIRGVACLYLMINELPAGVTVPEHTDTLLKHPIFGEKPKLERWHLPIITNADCYWYDEVNGKVIMESGFWYGPVPYWHNHSVANLGKEKRIHLVVDLDLIGESK